VNSSYRTKRIIRVFYFLKDTYVTYSTSVNAHPQAMVFCVLM